MGYMLRQNLKDLMLVLLGIGILYGAEAQEGILRLGFSEQEQSFRDMPPLNVFLVVDTSRSMAWDGKISWVKKALAGFVPKLRDSDALALISFNTAGNLRFSLTLMDSLENRRRFLDAAEQLSPQGGTRLEAGFNAGYEEVTAHYQEDKINLVILFSDEADFASFDFKNTQFPVLTSYHVVETYKEQAVGIVALQVGNKRVREKPLETAPVFYVMGQDSAGPVIMSRMVSQPNYEVSRISRGTGGISLMSKNRD